MLHKFSPHSICYVIRVDDLKDDLEGDEEVEVLTREGDEKELILRSLVRKT